VAANFKGSMIVYGGQSENGLLCNEMLVFQLDTFEWLKITLKQANVVPTFVQGGVCSVVPPRQTLNKEGVTVKKVSVGGIVIFVSPIKCGKVFTISAAGARTANWSAISSATSSLSLSTGRWSTANSST